MLVTVLSEKKQLRDVEYYVQNDVLCNCTVLQISMDLKIRPSSCLPYCIVLLSYTFTPTCF